MRQAWGCIAYNGGREGDVEWGVKWGEEVVEEWRGGSE